MWVGGNHRRVLTWATVVSGLAVGGAGGETRTDSVQGSLRAAGLGLSLAALRLERNQPHFYWHLIITNSVSKSLSNNNSKCILKQPFKSALRKPLRADGAAHGSLLGWNLRKMGTEAACVISRRSLTLLISKSGLNILFGQASSTFCELLLYLCRYIRAFIGIF